MMTIAEKWNDLPVAERIEIAKAAGLEGKIGSSSWDDMHHSDKDRLIDWSSPSSIDEQAEESTVGKAPKVRDYLLWIGYGTYPTIDSFLIEAEQMGVSRRISKMPNEMKLGESRVFLAHDEGETGEAVIFAYFVPTAVEIITYREGKNGIPENLKGIATPITMEDAEKEPKRGCGFREDVGALYLVSGEISVLKPTKDYNAIIDQSARRFRGIKKVDGKKILRGRNKAAPSKAHRVPRSQKIMAKKSSPWSEKEKETLRDLLTKHNPWRALREMHKISGRSVNAVAYQYNKMRKEGL